MTDKKQPLTWERYGFIEAAVAHHDALPDGAFVQALADDGIDTEELRLFTLMEDALAKQAKGQPNE